MNRFNRYIREGRAAELLELVDQGLTPKQAQSEQDRRDRHARAVAWLTGHLFPEESDFMGDSHGEAELRKQGGNPMRTDYIAQMNAKREALGIPPLAPNGMATGPQSRELCARLVDGIVAILAADSPGVAPSKPYAWSLRGVGGWDGMV